MTHPQDYIIIIVVRHFVTPLCFWISHVIVFVTIRVKILKYVKICVRIVCGTLLTAVGKHSPVFMRKLVLSLKAVQWRGLWFLYRGLALFTQIPFEVVELFFDSDRSKTTST